MPENLTSKVPEAEAIVFNFAGRKISYKAWMAVRYALNQRRAFCSNDSKPQTFIADMNKNERSR